MDPKIIYAKTPNGDEAVRQSTRVVQRNLRMVLVQIDGKTSVAELAEKIGNPRLVESAIKELSNDGLIAPVGEASSAKEKGRSADAAHEKGMSAGAMNSALSQFSTFDSRLSVPAHSAHSVVPPDRVSQASQFSSFGRPVLPASVQEPAPKKVEAPAEKKRTSHRKGIPLGKIVSVGLAGAVVAIGATALLYPYGRFLPAIETVASQWAGEPTRVGDVHVRFFPKPQLVLSSVTIGAGEGSRISEIAIDKPWGLLGSGAHTIDDIEMSGLFLKADQLAKLPLLSGGSVSSGSLAIRRIRLDGLKLQFGSGPVFGDMAGNIIFANNGGIQKATFETADRGLLVDAQPSAGGLELSFEGRGWKPDGLPSPFASLQAKGRLQPGVLLIRDVDTTFLGGILRGNWLFEWHNGLAMAGDATLLRLSAASVAGAFAPSLKIDGEMNGAMHLRSRGQDWDSLWKNAEAGVDSQIVRGIVQGVDLGEMARRGPGAEVRGGATRFDSLRSSLDVGPRRIVLRNVQLDAGMVKASGQFSADRQAGVDGNMTVNLRTSVTNFSVPVRIYGTLPDLVASNKAQ